MWNTRFSPKLRGVMAAMILLSGCSFQQQPATEDEAAKKAINVQSIPARTFLSTAKRATLPKPAVAPEPELPKLILRDSPEVRRMLRAYTSKQRSFITDGIARGEAYMPLIEAVFKRHNLPLELSNVAHVESRFITNARSSHGAVGIWQFMKPTARRYGLTVNGKKDERKDARKATDAAARYLKDLHAQFGDWYLALGAYNAGPGRISRAINKCNTTNFFELADCASLSKETVYFVAKIIAITLIRRHPDLYGFEDELSTEHLQRLEKRAERSVS